MALERQASSGQIAQYRDRETRRSLFDSWGGLIFGSWDRARRLGEDPAATKSACFHYQPAVVILLSQLFEDASRHQICSAFTFVGGGSRNWDDEFLGSRVAFHFDGELERPANLLRWILNMQNELGMRKVILMSWGSWVVSYLFHFTVCLLSRFQTPSPHTSRLEPCSQSLALSTFILTIKAALGNRECLISIETFKIAVFIPFLMSSASLSCSNVPFQHISLRCRPYPSRDFPLIRLRFAFNPKAKIDALHRINESGNPFRRHFIHSHREFFQSSKQRCLLFCLSH